MRKARAEATEPAFRFAVTPDRYAPPAALMPVFCGFGRLSLPHLKTVSIHPSLPHRLVLSRARMSVRVYVFTKRGEIESGRTGRGEVWDV